jgi:hypothetical protein
MALKHQIQVLEYDLSRYMKTAGERGGVVCLANTGNFTPDMDHQDNVVSYAADPSGKEPAGLLLHTLKDYDVTEVGQNYQNMNVLPLNSKVTLMRKGTCSTDRIDPSRLSSIVPGPMYLTGTGYLTDEVSAMNPQVGRFMSSADSDGFVKVSVHLD